MEEKYSPHARNKSPGPISHAAQRDEKGRPAMSLPRRAARRQGVCGRYVLRLTTSQYQRNKTIKTYLPAAGRQSGSPPPDSTPPSPTAPPPPLLHSLTTTNPSPPHRHTTGEGGRKGRKIFRFSRYLDHHFAGNRKNFTPTLSFLNLLFSVIWMAPCSPPFFFPVFVVWTVHT